MLERRLGRALDLRTPKTSFCGPWALPVLMILVATAAQTSGSSIDCCPENSTWVYASWNCSDGSRVSLNCPNNESVLLDSAEFVIEEDDEPRLTFLYDLESLYADRFCVSGNAEKDHWALVCFDGSDDAESEATWRNLTFGILNMISVIFLTLTLVVYAVLPELRDIQDKAMACVVAFLAPSYFLLGIEKLRDHPYNDLICVPLAFAVYWGFLSVFFWMNIVSFNVWRSIWFKNFPLKDNKLFPVFCAVGFIGPGLFLIAAIVAHHTEGPHLKPGFGEYSCWFGGKSELWAYFYGPMAILLIINVIYLGLTCWRLWFEYRGSSGSGLRSLRYNCLLYTKLVLVMGITWIFEVISFAAGNSPHWLITDIINSLQGVIIFIILVATRPRVKKLLARKKPCGLCFPKSWDELDDEDASAPALDVEMEFSHSGLFETSENNSSQRL